MKSNQQPTNERVKPILRWPGGKSRLLKKLLPMIPPHETYCEVFTGGAAVFAAKERSPHEIINDINGDLVALYLNIQRHLPEMLRQIEMFLNSRQLLYAYAQQPGLTDIERASRFLLRSRISFGADMHSFGVIKTPNGGGALQREKVKALAEQLHRRLDGVVIEHLSYERCLELYDSEKAFFFMDPPYVDAPTGAYKGWTQDDAIQFRKRVRKLKAKWLITLNDSPFTRHLFQDCNIETVLSKNQMVNNAKNPTARFGELIITPK